MNTVALILVTALIPSQGTGATKAQSTEHQHQVEQSGDKAPALTPSVAIEPLKTASPQATPSVSSPAQHDGSMQHTAPGVTAPYSGQESREIKSLSAEQTDQLLGGHGMGLALAAELNHYPGPKHVLELSARLGLSAEQTTRIEAVRAAMSDEAVRLGKQIVEQERALDQSFSSGRIDATELRRLTGDIARRQGELRAAHLGAHLAVRALLSRHQTHLYDELRGYAGGPTQPSSPAATATPAPTSHPSVYYSVPSWAPDGRTISFESNREGQAAVYTIRPDGSRLIRLTPAGTPGEQPNWSADGQRIVFASTRDGNKQLFLMKPDGTGVVAVPDSRNGFLAAFSPDGDWLLFATQDERPSMTYRAVVMRPDGSMRRQLGDPAKSNEDPRWTVDGRRIRLTQVPLLERQPNEAPRDFLLRRRGAERQVLVSIDGSDVQVVAPEQPAPATRDRGLSPDGRWILLSKTVEGVTGLYLREQPSGRETLLDPRPR